MGAGIMTRHTEIMRLLKEHDSVTVQQLAELFDVSTVTIRNDLNLLAEEGRIQRVHGGAVSPRSNDYSETTFSTRHNTNATSKALIGQVAASLIEPLDFILLDSSTTALAIGRALKDNASMIKDLTVVTTGIWTAVELMDVAGIHVVVAGGNLRDTTGTLLGPLTRDFLKKLNMRRAFLGAWGITIEEGMTDTNLLEIELKQTILDIVDEIVIVADSTKFGEVGLASFATLADVDQIVTDTNAPSVMIEEIRTRGITVHLAG